MSDSVYRVTEVIGVSSESWEQAARNAVEAAGQSVRELRIAEVVRQDVRSRTARSPSSGCGSASRSSTTRVSRWSPVGRAAPIPIDFPCLAGWICPPPGEGKGLA